MAVSTKTFRSVKRGMGHVTSCICSVLKRLLTPSTQQMFLNAALKIYIPLHFDNDRTKPPYTQDNLVKCRSQNE
jgi:uncharacterized protein YpiB (UPF0302 family)